MYNFSILAQNQSPRQPCLQREDHVMVYRCTHSTACDFHLKIDSCRPPLLFRIVSFLPNALPLWADQSSSSCDAIVTILDAWKSSQCTKNATQLFLDWNRRPCFLFLAHGWIPTILKRESSLPAWIFCIALLFVGAAAALSCPQQQQQSPCGLPCTCLQSLRS